MNTWVCIDSTVSTFLIHICKHTTERYKQPPSCCKLFTFGLYLESPYISIGSL